MRIFALPFLLIAAVGFVLSLVAHVLALLGIAMPGGGLVWALHVGIFVVWIPAIFLSRNRLQNVPRKNHMDAMLGDCPRWMRRAITILFAYAIVNFLLFLFSTIGQPKPIGA